MENNQESPFEQFEGRALVSAASEVDRVAFYKKTYSHVAGGVLVFILFEYLLLQSDAIVEFMLSMLDGYKWLLVLGGFMLITTYAESTAMKTADKNKQYLMYGLYILAQAIIFYSNDIYSGLLYGNWRSNIATSSISNLIAIYRVICGCFIDKKRFFIFKSRINHWIFYRFRINYCRNDFWV